MSKEAPWIALAIDWQDSEMLDGATHGIRLAWVCLLCFAKAQGRAGKVRLRDSGFARKFDLNVEAVRSMLQRAEHAGAVTIEGDVVTVANWRAYQDPRARSEVSKPKRRKNKADTPQKQHFSKTSENDATPHPPPPTIHPPPPPTPSANGDKSDLPADWSEVVEVLFSEGMGNPGQACRSAQGHGVLASEAMREVRHWQAHRPAWGLGLLYSVIEKMQPEKRVNWPEPGQDFAREKSRAETEKRQQQTATNRAVAQREREQNREDNERREKAFGEQLDNMPKAKLREFVEQHWPAMTGLVPPRGKLPAGLLRSQVLYTLELEAACTHTANA